MKLRRRGVAAGVYTQTTDVEGEVNGLMTYDREVQKLSAEELQAITRTSSFLILARHVMKCRPHR